MFELYILLKLNKINNVFKTLLMIQFNINGSKTCIGELIVFKLKENVTVFIFFKPSNIGSKNSPMKTSNGVT